MLLDLAKGSGDPDVQFTLEVGALHLARAIPEYWFTTAEQIASRLDKPGAEADQLKRSLGSEVESIFCTARRYKLITDLRRWDFHWEPLVNPKAVGANCVLGRGAPLRLTTGPNPKSSVIYIGGANKIVATGSGKRLGRTNYYQVRQGRFVDFERSEAVPLGLAIREFLDDMPQCIEQVLAIPAVAKHVVQESGEQPGELG